MAAQNEKKNGGNFFYIFECLLTEDSSNQGFQLS